MKKLLMGNQAIALGAMHAGVSLVSGYPGTPSTEVLETVARNNDGSIYVEWSVNEKVALEVAAGAAYTGARALVTMKQVGLNVASDPLMSLAYIGVKGGMVVLVADDPGPISSQTEQDTRRFASYAKIPVLDPTSPQEAYEMIGEAFALSERLGTPVLFRPTTRVCHACQDVEVLENPQVSGDFRFEKDSKWVIFPRLSYQNHIKLEERAVQLSREFSAYPRNAVTGSGRRGVVASGVSYAYAMETLSQMPGEAKLMKLATAYPFPEDLALRFLEGLDEVLVMEELDPVIEDQLTLLCGKAFRKVVIHGKRDGFLPHAGEYSVELLRDAIDRFLHIPVASAPPTAPPPSLPIRPPVLCAGCPHRASFYAVKQAMKGQRAIFCGDIGCYTLGNAQPLDMVDTCLCMGAGITMAQGLARMEKGAHTISFTGDSTFFHTGIPGVINAVYNQHDMTLVILDNATTAMTGHQPHPGIGTTMMREVSTKVDIAAVLRACGVEHVATVDPLDLPAAIDAVKAAVAHHGVSAVIFRSPCIAVTKPGKPVAITDRCVGCQRCIREIGCPALTWADGRVFVDESLCTGCGLCTQLCPTHAIEGGACHA